MFWYELFLLLHNEHPLRDTAEILASFAGSLHRVPSSSLVKLAK